MTKPRLVRAAEVIENADALDHTIAATARIVDRVLGRGFLRDLLHGVPLGHAAHPIAILVPAGAWISSAVLDVIPGQERAARALVGVGILGVLPAASAGIADWSLLDQKQKRVGIVHWAANLSAVALYSASFVQRSRGKRASGRVLGLLGLGLVSSAGYLGGHLVYRQGASVLRPEAPGSVEAAAVDAPPEAVDEPDFAEATAEEISGQWQTLGLLDAFQDGRLSAAELDDAKLIVLRDGLAVSVLVGTCSFCDDDLADGRVDLVDGASRVECPQDGSVYDLSTGAALRGPATAPLPVFESFLDSGMVEIRRAE